MAVTVEYIIILTGYFDYKGTQIAKIHITKDNFILFDKYQNELTKTTRMGDVSIVSGRIPYLSYGSVLRFRVQTKELFAISDDQGQQQIECSVTIPNN